MKGLIYTVFLVLLVASCKKKSVSFPSLILAGKDDGMAVTYTGKPLYPSSVYPNKSYKIDIDDDGKDDILLYCRMTFFSQIGLSYDIYIHPIHTGIDFYTKIVPDTVFCRTGYQITTDQSGAPLGVVSTTEVCYKDANNCTIKSTSYKRKPVSLSYGDILDVNDTNFRLGRIYISELDSSVVNQQGIVNGINTVEYLKFIHNCSDLPVHKQQYIGVRITDTQGARYLGWLSLKFAPNGMDLKGWAIQRPED